MAAELTPAAGATRSAALRWRRQMRLAAQRIRGPFVSPAEVLQRLAAALEPAAAGGVAVPQHFVQRHFAAALTGQVPLARVESRLTDWVRSGPRVLHLADWFVGGGDWRRLAEPLDSTSVALEAQQLWAADLVFRDTDAYASYRQRLEVGRPMVRNRVRLDSIRAIDGYFQRYVDLFRSIEARGCLSLREASAVVQLPPRAIRRWASDWSEQELGFGIDADGRWLKLPGGQHRTAIARVLGLDTVPGQVRLVHAAWLRARTAGTVAGLRGLLAEEGGLPACALDVP